MNAPTWPTSERACYGVGCHEPRCLQRQDDLYREVDDMAAWANAPELTRGSQQRAEITPIEVLA